jgi:hypothetical protein
VHLNRLNFSYSEALGQNYPCYLTTNRLNTHGADYHPLQYPVH